MTSSGEAKREIRSGEALPYLHLDFQGVNPINSKQLFSGSSLGCDSDLCRSHPNQRIKAIPTNRRRLAKRRWQRSQKMRLRYFRGS